MESNIVSKKLLNRLPVYLDYLRHLPEDFEHISATAIAKAVGLGEVQVRKDLARVSHAGRRRTGRNREQLIRDIEACLDFATETGTIVVGAGKLGQALMDHGGFRQNGLNIMAGFDILPTPERSASGKTIYPISRLEAFCRYYDVSIGIIAVPPDSAQEVCNSLVACGVRAIWNFAPVHLRVPENVLVRNENLAAALTSLRLQLEKR